MFLFHELKLLYVIVPATGSNSFHGAMKKKYKDWEQLAPDPKHPAWKIHPTITHRAHFTAEQGRDIIGTQTWNEYTKIGFVRHPYWWARSIYRKGGVREAVGINNDGTFIEFLTRLERTPYFWLADRRGKVLVDRIYRTEDFPSIAKEYGISIDHINRTKNNNAKEVTRDKETSELLKSKFEREWSHYDINDVFGAKFTPGG